MIPDQNCPIKAAERYYNTNFYRVTRKKINDNPRTAPKHSPHLQHQCKPIKRLLKCTSTPYREATLLLNIFSYPPSGAHSQMKEFAPLGANSFQQEQIPVQMDQTNYGIKQEAMKTAPLVKTVKRQRGALIHPKYSHPLHVYIPIFP